MPALLEVVEPARPVRLDRRCCTASRFAVEAGGITTILGANGAGKTTTLRAVCGMVKTTGEVRFDGQRIDGRATEDIVRLGIAHAPEGRGTFVDLTVEENLRLGAYARRDSGGIARDYERVYEYFPVLAQRRRQQAGTLSGGEQQMLAVARALMSRPRLLLLDEPSLGLAPLVVREIFRIVQTINKQRGRERAPRRAERGDRARPGRSRVPPRDGPRRHGRPGGRPQARRRHPALVPRVLEAGDNMTCRVNIAPPSGSIASSAGFAGATSPGGGFGRGAEPPSELNDAVRRSYLGY